MTQISNWFRSVWLSPALVGLSLIAIALAGPVGEEIGICPYRNLFGVACPGCGMSRATAHLLDGNVGAAMTYHPLVPLFVAQAIVGSALWIGHKRGWWTVSRRTVVVIGVVNIVLLSGVWIARAATGTLPPI